MESHAEQFTKVYADNAWGGSGSGSMLAHTVTYRKYLQEFLKDKNIKTVVDFGCGYFESMSQIDWEGIEYTGIDCVAEVQNHNANTYSGKGISFGLLKSIESFNSTLYGFDLDLLILKDVLMHWHNEDVVAFLNQVKGNFKYILITNSCGQVKDWQESKDPILNNRPLHSKFEPLFGFEAKHVMYTQDDPNDKKEISLITRHGS